MSHPAVREVEIVTAEEDGPDHPVVARVVTEVGALSTKPGAAERRVESWRQVYDAIYHGADRSGTSDDFSGWSSAVDRRPISAADMSEWRDMTARAIVSWRPRRVLEIGAGAGLVMAAIAPSCDAYWATDVSPIAAEILRNRADNGGYGHNVEIRVQPAHLTYNLPTGYFDTIVLNSVIQYFPSSAYLTDVLTSLTGLAADNARIFVGDVRNRRLLSHMWSGITVSAAPPGTDIRALGETVRRKVAAEDELCVDPEYFHCLRDLVPQLSEVGVELKAGRLRNEMTTYRYDVTLVKGAPSPRPSPSWTLTWGIHVHDLDSLRTVLTMYPSEDMHVLGVQNRRLSADRRAWTGLRECRDADALRDRIVAPDEEGMDPDSFRHLAEDVGRRVWIRWTPRSDEGRFDAAFSAGNGSAAGATGWPVSNVDCPEPLDSHANTPFDADGTTALEKELKAHLQKTFQGFQVPVHIELAWPAGTTTSSQEAS